MDAERPTPEDNDDELTHGYFGREHIAQVWMMYHEGIVPRGNDRIMLQVLTMHPEYYEAWDLATTGTREEQVVVDEVNPYLHAYFHAVVENQIETENPPEVAQTYKALLNARMDLHETIHRIAELLADQVWSIMHDNKPFDEQRYIRDLAKLRRSAERARRRKERESQAPDRE